MSLSPFAISCYFELNMIFIYMGQQVLPNVTGMFFFVTNSSELTETHFYLSNHFEMFTVCRISIDILVKYVIMKI